MNTGPGYPLQVRIASLILVCCYLAIGTSLRAQHGDDGRLAAQSLKNLSLEELMNIEVTLVSRSPEKLTEVASAIQVITRQDILRSGATSLPEALRLVSNLQVAQLTSGAWIISARGFNTIFANKLLVMIDGRTVYTPLFGGVLWDLQNVLLEDVARIEVVSGPGGTLWGANAVNGVINVITRNTAETGGTYVTVAAGDFLNHHVAARHGGKLGDNISYRVYAQNFDRSNTFNTGETGNMDAWNASQAGFRFDWDKSSADAVTFQGDFYMGSRHQTEPGESPFDGQNVLARWTHTISDDANFSVQAYFDRYWRDDAPAMLGDQMQTFDVDFQHQFRGGERHNIMWGLEYRSVNDHVVNRGGLAGILPARRNLDMASVFVQDEIALSERIGLTVGTKVLHNVFTGIEIQPSVRASLETHSRSLVWTAVSRAVRTPSRFDTDYFLPTYPVPPESPSVAGGPNFESEKLIAYEAGYRAQPNDKSTFSVAGFYNVYRDVYSVEALPGTLTYQIQNGSEGESWGGELMAVYQLSGAWRVRAGYSYLDKDLRNKPGRVFDPSYLGNDARHHALVQSMLTLPGGIELDLVARYLDFLPQTLATAEVPEYFTFDARLAFTWKALEASVVGQNLWRKDHTEFGVNIVPRNFYGRITCRF